MRRRQHDHHRDHRQRARRQQPGPGGDRPEGDPKRRALALAGDDAAAKQLVAGLYREFGFDALDIGGLDESWRIEVGQPAFVVRQNLAELTANVARAKRPV